MREPDPYSSLAEKYRFILQLAEGTPVVLRGPYWTEMAADFSRIGHSPDAGGGRELTAFTPGAALLIDLPSSVPPDHAGALLPELMRGGVAVVLSRSRQAPWLALRAFRRPLVRAGMMVHEFRAVPDLPNIEAFVAPGGDRSSWQLAHHRFRAIARDLIRRPEQQRFLFVVPPDRHTGFAEAANRLQRATGESGFGIERYHLRRRGALVLVLRRGERRRVLRVATNPAVGRLVLRNHECTTELLSRPGLPAAVGGLIPRPLGRETDSQADVFIEEYRGGRLAWTIYREPHLQSRLDRELFRFTRDLQLATRRTATMGSELIESLAGHYLSPLHQRFGGDHPVEECLRDIRQSLDRRLRGRTLFCAVAHGDFGVGNALAMPDGALSAVIDWDQYFPDDVPGVDWCDYRLKAAHYRRNLIQGVRDLVTETSATGSLAPQHGGFGLEDFGLTRADMRLVPCLAALRELARSARFPAESSTAHPDYRDALAVIARLLHEEP
jgi:hypothetical protein